MPENYSNAGTLGDFSVEYRREFTSDDGLTMSVRDEIARYDIFDFGGLFSVNAMFNPTQWV